MSITSSVTIPTPTGIPLANLRELGGMPVAEGGVLRRNTLWRSDDVALAPAWQMAELMSLGLRTIIDLRSDPERHRSGPGHGPGLGLSHHQLPLLRNAADPQSLAKLLADVDTPHRVGLWYANLFRAQSPRLIEAMSLIANSEGSVLFHCAAGKDRTGILAVAILSAIGADRDAIVEDYMITQPNMVNVRSRLAVLTRGGVDSGKEPRSTESRPILLAHRDSIASLLTDLDQDGGPLEVLRSSGFDQNMQNKLHARLVETR
jgi:protein-tyrosine phosphatase